MKFVDRQVSTEVLFRCLDDYLQWKENPTGEAEKNIKFITVVGTSGKGKTTLARRFMDLSYSGNYADIVNDCKEMNRRYRVRCTKFDIARDAETQLSLIILFEAFKYSSGACKIISMNLIANSITTRLLLLMFYSSSLKNLLLDLMFSKDF
jgi:hypothetical protein